MSKKKLILTESGFGFILWTDARIFSKPRCSTYYLLRTALFDAIGGLLPYQPIAQPMGETATEDIEHYQIPGRLRLTLTATADGLARLRLENLQSTPLQVLVLDEDEEIVEAAHLDKSQPVVELTLDPGQSRVLVIGDADQPERYRIPLFAPGAR